MSDDIAYPKNCDRVKAHAHAKTGSFLRQTRESSPINDTKMSMHSWYPCRYELKDHLSKLESMKMRRFPLSRIS